MDRLLNGNTLTEFAKGAIEYSAQFSGWHYKIFGSDLFFIPLNQLDCDGGCPQGLRCYSDDRFSLMFTHQPSADVPCDHIVIVSANDQTLRENQVLVYPNPSHGNPVRVSIRSLDGIVENVYYEVVDLSGRKVVEEIRIRRGNEPWHIDLKPGVYILTVRGKDWWDMEKILVY